MKKTECTVYKAQTRMPAEIKRVTQRRTSYLIPITLAVGGCLCVILLGALFGRVLGGFSAENGFLPFGREPEKSETQESSSQESEESRFSEEDGGMESDQTESQNQSSAEESESQEESGSQTESETQSENIGPVVFSVDLSDAEKGNGYLINYSEKIFDIEGILAKGFEDAQSYYSEAPAVLILHADTEESYADAEPGNKADAFLCGVVSVGEKLSEELNRQGIPTVHCTVIHGGKDAYASAAETVKSMKEIYPSLRYVIDLHRIGELADLNTGRLPIDTQSALGTAQVRVTVSAEGSQVRESLSLALALRRNLNLGGRRLCMPTVVTDSVYFNDPPLCYLKLDVGASGNTLSEAIAAGKLLAEALAEVMKK